MQRLFYMVILTTHLRLKEVGIRNDFNMQPGSDARLELDMGKIGILSKIYMRKIYNKREEKEFKNIYSALSVLSQGVVERNLVVALGYLNNTRSFRKAQKLHKQLMET